MVQDSSVRAQGGVGAVAHATSVDSDAEGGIAAAASAMTTASTGTTGRPPLSGRPHRNHSVGTAPLPMQPMEPALSTGICASADTVQAPDAKQEPVASDVAGMAESKAPQQAATSAPPPTWGASRGGGSRNRPGGKFKGMDPITPVTDPALLDSIYTFYGIPESFPLRQQLVTRSGEPDRPKRLSFVSAAVRDVLAADEDEKLKVMMTGVKVFERQESKELKLRCNYRIAQEGMPCVLPYLSKQVIRASLGTFLRLLKERSLPVPAEYKAPEAEEIQENKLPADKMESEKDAAAEKKSSYHTDTPPLDDPDCLAQMKSIRLGCAIVILKDAEAAALGLAGSTSGLSPMTISCWRGITSINILVSKQEAAQLVEKIEFAQKATASKTE